MYVNEIPSPFIYEIKTEGYDVKGVNEFYFKNMTFHFKKRLLISSLQAELSSARSARSGAPWVRKFGYLSIREILVIT